MPKFSIDHSSQLPAAEAFQKVKSFLETDGDLKKLDPKINFVFDPGKRQGTAKGSMFSAELKVESHEKNTHVEISVDLPFALMMIKGMVTKTLSQKLDENLV